MFSLARTIDHIAPRLPAILVSPEAVMALRQLAESVPASVTHWLDFECRLRADRPQVDLSIRIDSRGRDWLARDSAALPELFEGAAWSRVNAFARAWADASTPIHLGVAAVWLEFDLDGGADAARTRPRLFIDFSRRARARIDPLSAIAAALAPIMGNPPPASMWHGIARCVKELPPASEVLYIGVPATERVMSVRICVLGIGERRAAEYLQAVGWRGNVAALGIRPTAPHPQGSAQRTHAAILHFEIDDQGRVRSRMGLEYPFRRQPQVKGVISDAAFLDDLVVCGACAADKRDALMGWPGCEMSVLPHEIWPSLVMRRVSHVKIVRDQDEPLEAKTYLCVAHEWRHDLVTRVRRPPLLTASPIAS